MNPQLRRDIQLISTVFEGRRMIMALDPLNLAGNNFAMDMTLVPLLQLLDGRHDLRDIQTALIKQGGGSLIPLSEVASIIKQLDGCFLLESDDFREKMRSIEEEFSNQRDRHPVHGGNSYDPDPEKLGRFIEDIEKSLPPPEADSTNLNVTGMLAPHIDIKVAKETYVNLYRHLKGQSYDLAVIFGINHHWQDGLYSVSDKNYMTPFGKLETDKEFINELKKRVPPGTLTTSDFGHKAEHSIEFQTIFLHYYLTHSVPIVPILCGGVHEFIFKNSNIFEDERFCGMVGAIEELIRLRGNNVLFVSGVDFSHIGLKFDDQLPAQALVPRARSNDQKIISFLMDDTPEKIFENAVETQDRFNVCGLPSILIFSKLVHGSRARLLSHETYDERETQSAVTYASMIFSKP